MLELLLFFGAHLEQPMKTDVREYTVENLYSESYKMCSLESFTMFFEQPLECVDRDFIIFATSKIGFEVQGIDILNEHLIRTTATLKNSAELEVVSTPRGGEFILMKLIIKHNSDESFAAIKAIGKVIEENYGLFSSNPKKSLVIDNNLDLHIDQGASSTEFTFIKRDGYHML